MVESCTVENTVSAAGKQEDGDAFFVLGIRYSTGRDVEHDLIAAHKWFNLAAMMGHQEARRCRADLAAEMPADQVAEAQRRARAWLANREAKQRSSEAVAEAVPARLIYVRRRAQQMRSAMAFARVGA